MMVKFKLNILRLLLSESYLNKGNNCCFTDCKKTEFWACIRLFMNQFDSILVWYYSFFYESVWFSLGIVIDTIVLYSLILVYLTLVLIQSKTFTKRSARKQKLQQYLTKFSINLNEIWCTDETCKYDEPHYYFILSIQYSRERTLLMDFVRKTKKKKKKNTFNIGLFSDIYRPISIKLSIILETTRHYVLISVWMTLTFIQGHIFMSNQKLWCPFSCKSGCRFGWNSVCCHNLFVCWSSW